jgi:hypothetical protein
MGDMILKKRQKKQRHLENGHQPVLFISAFEALSKDRLRRKRPFSGDRNTSGLRQAGSAALSSKTPTSTFIRFQRLVQPEVSAGNGKMP